MIQIEHLYYQAQVQVQDRSSSMLKDLDLAYSLNLVSHHRPVIFSQSLESLQTEVVGTVQPTIAKLATRFQSQFVGY